jgi:hypothetical protein
MKALLKNAKGGGRYTFENIRVKMPDGSVRKVPGVTLKVK